MRTLKARYESVDRSAAAVSRAASGWRYAFVLPRFLRRPVRLAGRLASGEIAVPRYGASMLSAVLVGGFGLYGAVLGGHMPDIARTIASSSGFAVEHVRISGNAEISEIDVLEALALDGMTSLIGIGAEEARQRLAGLPWVEQVSVRKAYPSALEIEIAERQPLAIWQSGKDLSLVEASGAVIAPFQGHRDSGLPLVVGLGAPEAAAEIIAATAAHGELASRVRAFVRIGERRWDLRFDNGVTVRLPEQGFETALAELAAMQRSRDILARDIEAIDMRLADRLIVQLTGEAAERRAVMLADRARRQRQGKGV